jgi:1,4-alpha-glucan branching enzyme
MNKEKISVLLMLLLAGIGATSQVVWTEPALPSQDDVVTLYYDAAEGNGELTGVIPVYIHTGVITSNSSGPSDWQNVQTNWGTADANAVMSFQGGTLHTFDFNGMTLADYYGLEAGESIESLAMVFRNAPGTLVGRNADGSDIFYAVSDGNYAVSITSPALAYEVMDIGDSFEIACVASEASDLSLLVNGIEVASVVNATELNYTFEATVSGGFDIEAVGVNANGETASDVATLTVLPASAPQSWPAAGAVDGITYLDESTVRLQVFAPGKEFIFVTGDFNDWTLDFDYMMTQTPDQQRFWIEIEGLTPGEMYRFHYHIMPDNIRVTDAHTELVLYPNGDQWIPEETFPNMPDFPNMLTANSPVGVLTPGAPGFGWTDDTFERPANEDLIIYELLVRDFSEERNYQMILDTLDYLERLGINALELMPVNEFNGNDSWGYNPTFYWAPDKAYGTKAKLQELINECHARDIAVILDVVWNHADQPNPFLMMYWDAESFKPADNNPWFNVEAPHALNWFYDWNHESGITRDFVKRTLSHWIDEYHVDGFRWDFTQGLSQTPNGNGAYDVSRIAILNDYGNHVWAADAGIYMILEHWCDISEEAALMENGFMVWANATHDYQEAAMGYPSNLNWANYQSHNTAQMHVVSYAESHDEERLMYKNLEFASSNGTYDASDLNTALHRMEAIQCFNLALPGPKMLWQFQELGYDYSINTCSDGVTVDPNCRVEAKPVRWDYRDDPNRYRIYEVISGLSKLKREYPGTFRTSNFTWDVGGYGKRLILNGSDFDAVVVANFHTQDINMVPGFTHEGTWYDYFTGESFEVTSTSTPLPFAPGEYHVFLDQPIEAPTTVTSVMELERSASFSLYPNPATSEVMLNLEGLESGPAQWILVDAAGRTLAENSFRVGLEGKSAQILDVSGLAEGAYILIVHSANQRVSVPFFKQL